MHKHHNFTIKISDLNNFSNIYISKYFEKNLDTISLIAVFVVIKICNKGYTLNHNNQIDLAVSYIIDLLLYLKEKKYLTEEETDILTKEYYQEENRLQGLVYNYFLVARHNKPSQHVKCIVL